MLESLRADPCRFVEALFDIRQLRRIWRTWKRRGTTSLLDELSSPKAGEAALMAAVPALIPAAQTHRSGVLVIDAGIPRFDCDAGARSSFQYLRLLREMGHEVYFMPNDQLRKEPYATILEGYGIRLMIGREYRCGRWADWLCGQTEQIHHALLHRPNIARRYLGRLRRFGGIGILYFAHDLRHMREMRHYQLTGDRFYRSEATYWEGIEKDILAEADSAYFYSAEEATQVMAWGGKCKVHTIPLFPDERFDTEGLSYEERNGLLFVGGFIHQPNLDAVQWFAKEVFPVIRNALRRGKWRIVGRDPPDEILKLAGEGIAVLGEVSDAELELLYRSARVVVAPLRFGAGVKGKVVEAMCRGVPVVTTSIGAEGIADAEHSLSIASDAGDLAARILALYTDAVQWESLRRRALDCASKSFSREAAIASLAEGLGDSPSR